MTGESRVAWHENIGPRGRRLRLIGGVVFYALGAACIGAVAIAGVGWSGRAGAFALFLGGGVAAFQAFDST